MAQVDTLNVSNLTSQGAKLNGEVTSIDSSASDCDAWFEWRQTGASSWNITTTQTLSDPAVYSESLELLDDTEYEFRAVADDGTGEVTGTTETFTTNSFGDSWTPIWQGADSDISVLVDSSVSQYGGAVIDYDTTGGARRAYIWEDFGSVKDVNVAAYVRRTENSDSTTSAMRVHLRTSKSSETSYFTEILKNSNTSTGWEIRLSKYDSGTLTFLDSAEAPNPVGTGYYWIRADISGSTLQAKVWPGDEKEPTNYQVGASDSAISSGYVGFGSYSSDRQQWDYFAANTDGEADTAKLEPFSINASANATTDITPKVIGSVSVNALATATTDIAPTVQTKVYSNRGGLGGHSVGAFTVGEGANPPTTFIGRASGSTQSSGEFSTTSRIHGSSLGTGDTAGEIFAPSLFRGSALGTTESVADPTELLKIYGDANASADTAGNFTVAELLFGDGAGSAETDGFIVPVTPLHGTALGTTESIGDEFIAIETLRGSAAGTTDSVITVVTSRSVLSGTSSGKAATDGTITPVANVHGNSAGEADGDGQLRASATLGASSLGTTETAARFRSVGTIAGIGSGSAVTSGSVTGMAPLFGGAEGNATAVAVIAGRNGLSGTASGSSNAGGGINTIAVIAGESAGEADAQAVLTHILATSFATTIERDLNWRLPYRRNLDVDHDQ